MLAVQPRGATVMDTTETDDTGSNPESDSESAFEGHFDAEAMLRESLFPPAKVAGDKPAGPVKGGKGKPGAEAASEADEDPESPATDDEEDAGTADSEDGDEESDDDDAESADAAELLKNPEALLKAHEEIKAKAAKRKERIAELEAALAERPAHRQGAAVLLEPTPRNPLSNVASAEDLADAEKYWRSELQWCRKNRDGGERTVDGQAQEWDADQVSAREDLAISVLGEHLVNRRAYIAENQASVNKAREQFPFLAPNHALHREADVFVTDLIRRVPEFSQHPRWPELASQMFAGHLATSGKHAVTVGKDGKVHIVSLTSDKAKTPLAKAPVKKPPVRSAGSPPPGKTAGPTQALDDAIDAALSAGDVEEANRLMLKAQFARSNAA